MLCVTAFVHAVLYIYEIDLNKKTQTLIYREIVICM